MNFAVADDFACVWALSKDIKAPEWIRNRKRDLTQSQSGKMHLVHLCYLHYTVNWRLGISETYINTNMHEKHPTVWLQLQGKAWEARILNSSLWWKNPLKMLLEHNTDRFVVYFGLSKDRQHVTWQECIYLQLGGAITALPSICICHLSHAQVNGLGKRTLFLNIKW